MLKSQNALHPVDEQDWTGLKKVAVGEMVQVEIKKARNIRFHRKFFALMNLVYQNQDKYDDFKPFTDEVKLQCGLYETHISAEGKVFYKIGSISFAKMDETKFSEFYDKAVDVCIKHFLPGTDKDELLLQILDFT